QADWLVRPTAGGQQAQAVWRPLFGVIEQRWRERFGADRIAAGQETLAAGERPFAWGVPDCLPILGYGLISRGTPRERPAPAAESWLPLVVLLARVLLAFTLDFEQESEVALAIGANVLRLVGVDGVRVADLLRLAAVSKESLAMAQNF